MEISAADSFWNEFIERTGADPDSRCAGDLTFESKGFTNDALVALVLSGKKTALFSSFATYAADGEPIPVSGELYIVFDRGQTPRAVIELQSVSVIPFSEVTWAMASLEGECADLEEWRQKTRENLEDEGEVVGFEFRSDIKLIFQTFKVVYRS